MGSKAEDGEFSEFVETISAAKLNFNGMNVLFQSPSNGEIRFGWEGTLSVDNVEILIKDYRRYDNSYSKAEFNGNEIEISVGEHKLSLNWEKLERIVT